MKRLDISTEGPENWVKDEVKVKNDDLIYKISKLQRVLYAERKQSLLIVLQGVDASGKDGTVRSIFSGVNPLGCNVYSFKKPTEEEMSHDFLWRIHKRLPEKGMIHIFNRSHYEDILVPSVEGYIDMDIIEERYEHINNFEKLIESSGTRILKFYLHISKGEQLERLKERLENPTKFWKHNDGDWDSRDKWNKYMNVYEDIFEKCDKIPWHIIPADKNWVKVHYIASKILSTLEEMNPQWPGLETERF